MKLRKCKSCGERKPVDEGVITPLAFFCCLPHAVEYAREASRKAMRRLMAKADKELEEKAKEERKEQRQRKIDTKPLSYFHNRARIACHAYIRARDADLPCACCGTYDAAQWDASHYRPAGVNSDLRYNELNIHKCCSVCNQHKSGNLTLFRMWMVRQFGELFVQELESNHKTKRYTRAELEGIEAHYKLKLSELKKSKAA